MNLLKITILTICASVISAEVDQLLQRGNPVQQIEFDSESNVYVTTRTNTSTTLFHKLDWARNVTLKREFKNVVNFFVTKSNNIYIFDNDSVTYLRQSVYFLEPNADDFHKIYEIPVDSFAHIQDQDDNIYFNTALGVAVIKRDQKSVKSVLNLEYFNMIDHAVNDYGYTFLIGNKGLQGGKPVLAIIRSDQNVNEPARADVYEPPNPEFNQYLTGVGADYEGNVFVGFAGDQARILNAYSYGFSDVAHAEYLQYFQNFYATEKRLFFASVNLFNHECYLNFFHYEDIFSPLEVTRVTQQLNCDWLIASSIAADSAGNLFIPYANRLLLLRNNETEYRDIYFPDTALKVTAVAVDKNDVAWILRGSINKLNVTESLNAEELTGILSIGETAIIKINDETNEVFFGAKENLLVYY